MNNSKSNQSGAVIAANWRLILLLAGLVLAAYAPALNNGFISDDYVILQRAEELRHAPLSLFAIAPEGFRFTSYLSFLILKTCFGYRAGFFYGFLIMLHLANTLMFWRLLRALAADSEDAAIGAIFFATLQNPQEAVYWLAGMNESLVGAFILAALLLWIKGRYALSGLSCLVALFSKESALVLVVLVPLLDLWRLRTLRFRKEHLYILVPAMIFLVAYGTTVNANSLLANHLYTFSLRSAWVLLNSAHHLLFPWAYLALAIALMTHDPKGVLRTLGPPLLWIALTLVPYIFLVYQSNVPSRNQYVAAMGAAWLLALLAGQFPGRRCRYALAAVFAAYNIAYLWMVKDPQYVARAVPTELLIKELQGLPPARLRIANFVGNPWIAKETTQTVPGWSPDLLIVNQPGESCEGCPILTWDNQTRRFVAVAGHH